MHSAADRRQIYGLAAIWLLFILLTTTLPTQGEAHRPEAERSLRKLAADEWRNATKRAPGSVVPRPRVLVQANVHDYLEIEPTKFKLNDRLKEMCIIVTLASDRYSRGLLFKDVAPELKDRPELGKLKRVGHLSGVDLVPAGDGEFKCESVPHMNMDESYKLLIIGTKTLVGSQTIANNSSTTTTSDHGQARFSARIEANSSWGLLRGLETLSQLIFNVKASSQKFGIGLVEIEDEPRFKHRGFMLDTARHYISIPKIINILDAMAIDKLNVFHWHLVDDQSFPLESKTYPQLSKLSSFRPNMVYKPEDVRLVIIYAASRGIRVVPELDTPGHTYSLRHITNLLTECFDTTSNKPNGDFGPVDPTRASSYKIVDKLLHEFAQLFRDEYFHAGGDEVDFECWQSNERINTWMKEHNMSGNYEELTNYYMRNLYKLVKNHHKTMIVWQEVFDLKANLPTDNVIVHVWKNINDKPGYMAELANVVGAGYKALLSSCWYLNYIDYGRDWLKFYQCDPRGEPIAANDQHLVLGGEICMWTEYVDDTNVVSRTWPRASAAAERLWSSTDFNNPDEFLPRLEQHRCHLVRRGIQAEPVNGPGYC
uniref:Beta-hexosaminidase n=2 Tax=Aceria tosichella TaxID=561515 RepID=A0A6G1SPM8_9ACAR